MRGLNLNLECWFLWREENQRTQKKTLGAGMRTNNKLNPHVMPGTGVKPRPQWWKASSLTTAPSLVVMDVLLFLRNIPPPKKKSGKITQLEKSS